MTYADAHFPAYSTVAGVRLHPLSMGHAMLLARLGCPLIPGGASRTAEAGDVATLLWICSRPWRKAIRGLGSRWGRWWRYYVAGRVLARQTLIRQGVDAYLAAQLSGPTLTPGGSGGGTLYSPTLALIKVAAMVDLGLSEEDVLDRPLRLTLWDVAVAAERRGDVHLAPTTDAFQGLLAAAKAAQLGNTKPEVPRGE